MINKFSDFYTEMVDKRRIAFTLEDSYGDDEYRYCLLILLEIFDIPADTGETKAERILDGEGNGIHIATLSGNIILVGAMLRKGLSPVQICDEHSYLLGYAMKALTEQNAPLHDELDMCTSIFYIYDLIFDEPYRDSEFMTEMVKQIPNILLYKVNVHPDMVVYYPKLLPYKKDTYTHIKEGLAELAHKETIELLDKMSIGKDVKNGKPYLVLREEQLN